MADEQIPDHCTIGQKYDPAMRIHDQAEADVYFEACVAHNMRCQALEGKPVDRAEAERIERGNLGYYAGYYDDETRAMVERLFRCAHPVFGAIAERGPPTPEQAWQLGVEMGRRIREGESHDEGHPDG